MENHTKSDILTELATIRDFIRYGASRFNAAQLYFGHGTDNAWDEAVQIVSWAVHLAGFDNPNILDSRLTYAEKRQVLDAIELRIQERIPAAYITGRALFCGLDFYVDSRVLVPRSPIAELIEQSFAPWLSREPDYILDMCTGSGCIGIASALAFTDAQVVLSDISEDALAVAERNVDRYDLGHRVALYQSDLFADLHEQCFDLIVANPPYVDAEDLAGMPAEYHAEPEIGLGSGGDGLDFTRRLLREAPDYLNDGGLLVVEVGNSAGALVAAFPELPFTWVEFERGGHGVFVLTREQLTG
ncbi:50S ribosomal protein L3 N(5)-glutamine methyltransferase [Gilvimarinus agarilyticus]|uniref:50S ribosomal protein L3 N(5)-glutamine methyltransferase n=1 Tax=unclassified Gilvimarinus TaxID=2642066 RepID=UPI001C0A1640|nr:MULTISPECIES: 50S ribosomal protein L3 N(5)-glutamine methyltransferase [unclassified Gilvimarinus]MBU2885068.1 50S ribosomal protein L3 N(5)-glutamine methyltransferase [Gilvimarinus agarilyticus]MDO6569965.1 50S ribosomal protein L3 N(5)-glutamine methyltransferase [Gilvimarinus sp. 2_MG-2023]MDO6747231.1 50S ribosomal protein L3 N(5)-glutamine methyltransferase [Gilvimarinus sp. 1_MG-2023]